MVGHGLSPSWKKQSFAKGEDVNLPTCETKFSSKTVIWNTLESVVNSNPAYEPFKTWNDNTDIHLNNTNTKNGMFMRWITPANYKRATMYIGTNTINSEFTIYLAGNGPVLDGGITGDIVLKKKLFEVPIKGGDGYPSSGIFTYDGPDVFLASGHSYAFYFEFPDEFTVPSVGKLNFSIGSVIYFGGAGS